VTGVSGGSHYTLGMADGDHGSFADLESGPVLVVDFGAQYAQLIARRVRE